MPLGNSKTLWTTDLQWSDRTKQTGKLIVGRFHFANLNGTKWDNKNKRYSGWDVEIFGPIGRIANMTANAENIRDISRAAFGLACLHSSIVVNEQEGK